MHTIFVAGYFGEMKFAPGETSDANSGDDFERALSLAGGRCTERLAQLMRRSCDLVWSHWPDIEVIAGALLDRKTLSGDEIHQLLSV
jgi:hypothetical protein